MMTGFRISENYCFELAMFLPVMGKNNWRISVETELITKQRFDHTPRFQFIVIFLKWTIIEIGIYNKNHVEKEPEGICPRDW